MELIRVKSGFLIFITQLPLHQVRVQGTPVQRGICAFSVCLHCWQPVASRWLGGEGRRKEKSEKAERRQVGERSWVSAGSSFPKKIGAKSDPKDHFSNTHSWKRKARLREG